MQTDNLLLQLLQSVRSIPVEETVVQAVRTLCEQVAAPAGAILSAADEGVAQPILYSYDPQNLLATQLPNLNEQAASAADTLATSDGILTVSLDCFGENQGQLILLAPQNQADWIVAETGPQVTMLALLVKTARLNQTAGDTVSAAHDRFQSQVSQEVERSRRTQLSFSVVHLWVEHDPDAIPATPDSIESFLAQFVDRLRERLRPTDQVGRLAPNHLAILLHAAGSTGGLIAARRIQQLINQDWGAECSRPAPQLCFVVRSYPQDGTDAAVLCDVELARSAAKETTALIEESIKKVNLGTSIASKTAEALTEIVDGVSQVTDL
ncbi:MAG: hypothetical protein MJA84_01495, partial [Firmicutes bacterium]|nr:hypothetical protein [Bacillota bacterium]